MERVHSLENRILGLTKRVDSLERCLHQLADSVTLSAIAEKMKQSTAEFVGKGIKLDGPAKFKPGEWKEVNDPDFGKRVTKKMMKDFPR